jgi:hypothetical protein
MKPLREWGKNRSFLVECFGLTAASTVDEVYLLLEWLRTGDHLEHLGKMPPLNVWLRMYEGEKKMLRRAGRLLCGEQEMKRIWLIYLVGKKIMRLGENWLKGVLQGLEAEELHRMYLEAMENVRKVKVELEEEIEKELTGGDREEGPEENVLDDPAVQFALRVWAPCVIVRQERPCDLLALAKRHDTEAFLKLVKIDKAILFVPEISEWLHELANGPIRKRKVFERLARAYEGRPKRMKRREIKYGIAGFMSVVFGGIDNRLKEPDLRALFDSVSRVKTGYIDEDLPGPETLSKGIQRFRKEWEDREAGQKLDGNCPGAAGRAVVHLAAWKTKKTNQRNRKKK